MSWKRREFAATVATSLLALAGPVRAATRTRPADGVYNVRDYGARGDGASVDSPAINAAIVDASRAGGGTVLLPPGRYLAFSIRLLSNVTLILSRGCVVEAADPATHKGSYDLPESDFAEQFQDFGITQFHCSLIYADGAENIAIGGQGTIHGKGLLRADTGARWHGLEGYRSPEERGMTARQARLSDPREAALEGQGIRSVGIKNCRNVRLSNFTVLQGGHFSVHLLGVSNAMVEGLTIDTNRDGIDIDCCRDVIVSNCVVNAPFDDAIVVKSSYALGRKQLCENVTITGCRTSGFDMGTLLDGTRRTEFRADRIIGRIKLGTESNGGFRNILITNCRCEHSRGILVGVVDGGVLENVAVSNIVLHQPLNHPLFVRQAARLRAPKGTTVGACRRVAFSDVMVSDADPRYPCGVAGIVDGWVEDIAFSNIHVASAGGGTAADAALVPPERRESSLEVSFLKTLPAFGFWARHVRNLALSGMTFETDKPDARPAVVLESVHNAAIHDMRADTDPATAVRQVDCRAVATSGVTRLG
ncbi:glycoside hydrolase family 28 protein [Novosphingobium kaempferiae]|uniref:rhamnogalacturonidase n=1 Tax=Novosphingobium kaempferiae TaxID=2896849 RepID=UPI001E43AE07|nr:glycosyl hydrolase family 28-related protein [Novosphingobium kaempferiae]